MFDKKLYWERRKNTIKVEQLLDAKTGETMVAIAKPLRGQGDLPKPRLARWTEDDYKAGRCEKKDIGQERTSGVEMRMTKNGLVAYPRRDRRAKVVDRNATRKGFMAVPAANGTLFVRIGSSLHGIIQTRMKRELKAANA